MDRKQVEDALAEIGMRVDPAALDRLEEFEEALYDANATRNLTRVPREECGLRHFVDSVLFQDLIPQGAPVLDIGSGPGFPAWPLACLRPDLSVTALDSSGKMLAFQRSQPLPNLISIEGRAEDWKVTDRFEVVTGRALAPLSLQLELSARPCKRSGLVLPMRTPADLPEIERLAQNDLGLEFDGVVARVLPVIGAERICPVFRKVKPTPARYPRGWAEMRKRPL